MYEKKKILQSDPYERNINKAKSVSNVYWGEVISIDDLADGGRIKVRIPELDVQTPNINLPDCYPILPKFFHIYPQVGEVVRIILEDTKYPQRSRFYIGSIISQLQNIGYDDRFTALNTTNIGVGQPLEAISSIPEARGVFPQKKDVAIIGRNNTDFILRDGELELRAGKHEKDDVTRLNKKNVASLKLTFEDRTGSTTTQVSTGMMIADRIAIISHDGIPKFKAFDINQQEREKIFKQGHPLGRGDVIVEAIELLRRAIIEHIHGYPGIPADKSGAITELEKVDFTQILQRNIVIN